MIMYKKGKEFMMKTMRTKVIAGVAVMAFALSLPVAVQAQTAPSEPPNRSAQERQTTVQERAAERKAATQTRLQDAKLRSCEAREKAVTSIMKRMAERGEKQLALFTTISDRVQAFYSQKGNTLADYDALLAEVEAKKAAATTAVESVAAQSTGFSCDSDDPRGFVDTFKQAQREKLQALKDYKTAVKNLIVGVKSVQSTTDTPTESERE